MDGLLHGVFVGGLVCCRFRVLMLCCEAVSFRFCIGCLVGCFSGCLVTYDMVRVRGWYPFVLVGGLWCWMFCGGVGLGCCCFAGLGFA